MRVSFIGMSNIGKTYWAKRIAAGKGLEHINCDALIERKLEPQLAQMGYHGLREVAKWMGAPGDPQYEENSGQYMACEQAVMRETFDRLHADPKFPAVIDTTGSVIHCDAAVLAQLRATTRVIYFEASDSHIDNLFRRYIVHPKPTIWGDSYRPRDGETPRQTLKRCFPELLRERARRYAAIAHVTIPFEQHRQRVTDIGPLIDAALAGA